MSAPGFVELVAAVVAALVRPGQDHLQGARAFGPADEEMLRGLAHGVARRRKARRGEKGTAQTPERRWDCSFQAGT